MRKASAFARRLNTILYNGLFNETIGDNQPRTSTLRDGTRVITTDEGSKVTLPPAQVNPEQQTSPLEKR